MTGGSADTDHDWQSDLDLILDAARKAGQVALDYFQKSPEVWWKNEGRSPVSAADFAANDVLEKILRTARPSYGWLSEETEDNDQRLSQETLFVVDPIDGTRAFIAGLETWCVSVAVVHKGRPVAGVLVVPAKHQEYRAVLGGEACRNDIPLTVAFAADGAKRRIAVAEDTLAKVEPAFRKQVERITHVPSLAYRLAMVADGSIDATIVKKNSHDWDLAAADLILQCAGGQLVNLDGSNLDYNGVSSQHGMLCAASQTVLPSLLEAVRNH